MSAWVQHFIVFAIVLACAAFVLVQSLRTWRMGGGKVGSCCAKGCDTKAAPTTATTPPANRIVFLPAEMLSKRK